MSKKLLIVSIIASLVFVSAVAFGLYSKKSLKQVDESIVGNIDVFESSVHYFQLTKDGRLNAKTIDDEGAKTIAHLDGVEAFNFAAWSPDRKAFAVSVTERFKGGPIPSDLNPSSKLYIVKGNKVIYETQEAPSSFVFSSNNQLVLYFPMTEEGEGYFAKVGVGEGNKSSKILGYNSEGVVLKRSKQVSKVLFFQSLPDENWATNKIYELSLTNEKIKEYAEIENLVDYEEGEKTLLTKANGGGFDLYLKDSLESKEEKLIGSNVLGMRATLIGDRVLGFIAKNQSFELDKMGDTKYRDSLVQLYPKEKTIQKSNESLTNCYSPRFISKKIGYFICDSKLYKIKNPYN